MSEETEFQKKFKRNEEFYTQEYVIKTIMDSFPDDGRYSNARGFKGLIRIANGSIWGPKKPESVEELTRIIPSFYLIEQSISIYEKGSECDECKTSFLVTDCGYICIEKEAINF
ncbi:MAG: hypothetical protein Q8P15_01355 [Nanoarchaeota archaeon]|nr:hypothetical protein [Nanoarchaeota archaeon]